MINPVSSLAQMEMQLYGGMRNNPSAPSFYNNYCGTTAYNNGYNYFNNSMYQNYGGVPQVYGNTPQVYGGVPQNYNYANPQNYGNPTSFGQTIPQAYMDTTMQNVGEQGGQNPTIFQGLSKSESDALVKTYQQGLEPEQAFKAAVITGTGSAILMQNPRILAHPWNSIKTFIGFGGRGDTNAMFDFAKNSKLEGLWKDNSYLMEEAFAQMNRTEARSLSKLGLFRKSYSPEEYKQLKEIMEKALKSGKADEIAKATETLRHAQVNNGGLFRLFKGNNTPTIDSRIQDTAKIAENAERLVKTKNMTYKEAFNQAGGKLGLALGAMELIGDVGKIKTAFEEDKKTGFKQLGQSVIKAGISTLSWNGGEALGIWGASKLTPMIAKAVGGKWATIIGAVARPLCGLFCNWLGRKAAKKLVGENVANKIEAKRAAETNEGQLQIVENVLSRAQSGEKIDPKALEAVQKLYTMYA